MRPPRPSFKVLLAGALAIGALLAPSAGAANGPAGAAPAAGGGAHGSVPTAPAATAPGAATVAESSAPGIAVHADDAATRAFWTPRRMRAAVPINGPEAPAHASGLNPTLTATSETISDPTAP
jgi:hypothetical protein